VLVLPAGHPKARRAALDFAEVADEDFVSLSTGTSLAQRLQAESAAAGRRLKVRIQVRSFDAMCRMVAAGVGVAILPRSAAGALAPSLGLRMRRLTGMRTERRLLLAMRRRADLGSAARAFVDMVLPA